MSIKKSIGALLALTATFTAVQVAAQNYPARQMRLVIGFPAGGPVDIVGRLLAIKLGEVMGQQVIVENRVGANAIIGSEFVAKALPDGYTLLLASPGSLTISPAVYPKMPYDTMRDFAPVALVTTTPEVLGVHPSLPVKSVKDLIALAKSRPGQLNFASSGSGSLPHLALEMFKSGAKIDIVHVPYGGGAPAVTATISGQVQGQFADLPVVLPNIRAGKMHALAVTSQQRASLLSDVPTMAEQGFPDIVAVNWYGVLLPAKTPRDIVVKLHDGVIKALADPVTHDKMVTNGADPVGDTPEQFTDYIRSDLARWAKLTRTVTIKVD